MFKWRRDKKPPKAAVTSSATFPRRSATNTGVQPPRKQNSGESPQRRHTAGVRWPPSLASSLPPPFLSRRLPPRAATRLHSGMPATENCRVASACTRVANTAPAPSRRR